MLTRDIRSMRSWYQWFSPAISGLRSHEVAAPGGMSAMNTLGRSTRVRGGTGLVIQTVPEGKGSSFLKGTFSILVWIMGNWRLILMLYDYVAI